MYVTASSHNPPPPFLLAFVVFLICFCWAFTARSVVRVWLVLALGATAMAGLGWLVSNMTL